MFLIVNCSNNSDIKKSDITDFYVANWNVENLFDTVDDPSKNDEWFTPESEINWTERKLHNKMVNLARVIKYMNEENGPDILGVEEVENQKLLIDLVEKYIKNSNYKIAYSESPDARGIDNALIYNSAKFGIESVNPIKIEFDEPKSSRDILFVQLVIHQTKEVINVFVNHWPSRREGLKESEKFRINAAETLNNQIQELKREDPKANIIILGDFNDLPSNLSISKYLGAAKLVCDSTNSNHSFLYNLAYEEFQKGNGTYKYKEHWNMLDQIIISQSLIDDQNLDYKCGSFEIIKPEFVLQNSGKYAGTSLPTYGGRKYLGGYSDHFAIGAKFVFK
jgi:predicted extracellular nuclease